MYYYRARYYDPAKGRFVSEDPIWPRGGINPYSHIENAPMNHGDPSEFSPYADTVTIVTAARDVLLAYANLPEHQQMRRSS